MIENPAVSVTFIRHSATPIIRIVGSPQSQRTPTAMSARRDGRWTGRSVGPSPDPAGTASPSLAPCFTPCFTPRIIATSSADAMNDVASTPKGSAAATTNRAAPSGRPANLLRTKYEPCSRELALGRSSGTTTAGTIVAAAFSASVSPVPSRKAMA